MIGSIRLLVIIFLCSYGCIAVAQQTRSSTQLFQLKGEVKEAESNIPIPRVNIEITGRGYTTTNSDGRFEISAAIGDQLIVRSDDFQTVYHTVSNQDFIEIRVEKEQKISERYSNAQKKNTASDFKRYLDSARTSLKKDARNSIEYVTRGFESLQPNAPNASQNSEGYELLGDINAYWDLYDLAIDNYKRSLSAQNKISVQIKLASAFRNNKNFQESIDQLQQLVKRSLRPTQKIDVFEGLGDTYLAINEYDKSISYYQKALSTSKEQNLSARVNSLTVKLGEASAKSGDVSRATSYFGSSLEQAEQETPNIAAETKNKAADFYNANRNFDEEIRLREEALEDIEDLERTPSPEEPRDEDLTSQRQHYKIANAFILKNEYAKAIPYLEKSISEASKDEDLVVEKDATRKLSEIYRDIGNYDKASESYARYVDLVDELYIQKEQELSQAARFNKEIALKQNRIASLENERELNESRYRLATENQALIKKNNRVQQWIIGSLILVALLLLYAAYTQYRSIRKQKLANNQLALKSLRSQMNPHFIFNALNSVNGFIASNDERAANQYLSEFSQLMRNVLENSDEDFIPLAKEVELLQLYVKLEHFRFKNKFDYTIEIDDGIPQGEFLIPPMLLQPYVENAVWHGLRYKKEKGALCISFQLQSKDTVKITIEDNGIGRKQSKALKTEHQKKQRSKGMGNISKRISILNEMYSDRMDVTVSDLHQESEEETGTLVAVLIRKK
ncbi:histidine kinase [Flavobacteriaceae bacterium TK19130]|nr:histidine kinase [Thermobacterium salinum]